MSSIHEEYIPVYTYLFPQEELDPGGRESKLAQATSIRWNCLKVLCNFQWQADKVVLSKLLTGMP